MADSIGNPALDLVRRVAFVAVLAAVYAAVAKLGLELASINPSATPVWPPTGYALAMTLLLGPRVAPAIFIGALIANATTAGTPITWIGIAAGNTLECAVGGYLLNRYSNGAATFSTPLGVAKFALICLAPSTLISATIGVASLYGTGFARSADLVSVWATWWAGDLAGALVITPALVLWLKHSWKRLDTSELLRSGAIVLATVTVGLVAFSPFIDEPALRAPLAFLAILPLLAAALRCEQRDTANAILLLSGFAVWSTLAGHGPFARGSQNEALLLLLTFMISISVLSLALSAEVNVRRDNERHLRLLMSELSHRSKNLLAIVQGVANQIARSSDTVADFQTAFVARLQAIAQTHRLLVQENWEGTYIGDVARTHLAPFSDSADGAIVIDGPAIELLPKAAEYIGLAFYELATNAAKHGALSRRTGSVKLRWKIIGEDSARSMHIVWEEIGGPTVAKTPREGFGTTVLTKLVPLSLRGSTSLIFGNKGLTWELSVPLGAVLASPRKSSLARSGAKLPSSSDPVSA